MKRITITWMDSMTIENGGWVDADDIPLDEHSLMHETTGYLVGQSDDAVAIAHSRNAATDANLNTRFAGVVVIPRNAIRSGI